MAGRRAFAFAKGNDQCDLFWSRRQSGYSFGIDTLPSRQRACLAKHVGELLLSKYDLTGFLLFLLEHGYDHQAGVHAVPVGGLLSFCMKIMLTCG
jgi:hypothetical protein